MNQAEQRAPGAPPGARAGHAKVVAQQVRLAIGDLDRPVGSAGATAEHDACA
jgi:hypothetical protein